MLLSKVSDKRKLTILQRTGNKLSRSTALHEAAERGHNKVISTILSSFQSSTKLHPLLIEKNTPLHVAVSKCNLEPVMTILDSLPISQQIRLLTAERNDGQTPLGIASARIKTELWKHITTVDQQELCGR